MHGAAARTFLKGINREVTGLTADTNQMLLENTLDSLFTLYIRGQTVSVGIAKLATVRFKLSLPNKLLKEKCSGQKSAEKRPDTLFLVDACNVKMRVGRKKRFPCIKKRTYCFHCCFPTVHQCFDI